MQVDGTPGRHRAVLTGGHGTVVPFDQVLDPLRCLFGDGGLLAGQTLQMRRERGGRGKDLEGITMGVHDRGIGVLGEEGAQAPLMGRGLEEPPLAAVAPLQELQELAVVSIGGSHIGLPDHPTAVARHVEGRGEKEAPEVPRGDRDALLSPQRTGRVDRLKARDQGLGHRLGDGRILNARIGAVGGGLRRRMRLRDLPRERHPEPRVLRQQIEEDRRAGARLADDQHRVGNLGSGDLRVAVVPVRDPQPALEEVDEHRRRDPLTDRTQITFGLERVDEAIQSLLPRVLAEVRQARLVGCTSEQRSLPERRSVRPNHPRVQYPRS